MTDPKTLMDEIALSVIHGEDGISTPVMTVAGKDLVLTPPDGYALAIGIVKTCVTAVAHMKLELWLQHLAQTGRITPEEQMPLCAEIPEANRARARVVQDAETLLCEHIAWEMQMMQNLNCPCPSCRAARGEPAAADGSEAAAKLGTALMDRLLAKAGGPRIN